MAMLLEIGDKGKQVHGSLGGTYTTYICAVVVAAGALHLRYDHYFRLGAGSTIHQHSVIK